MMRAAKGLKLGECLKSFVSTPEKLVQSTVVSLPARLVFLVYFGTFSTANLLDTVRETTSLNGSSSLPVSAKFGAVTTISTGLTIYKDARMAQYFGNSRIRRVPTITYSLCALRDAMTIYASFILPDTVASNVKQSSSRRKFAEQIGITTENGIRKTAQFVLPAMAQFFTTPVHLLGLSHFNQPSTLTVCDRIRCVFRDLSLAIPIRVIRIVPAFGFGGVINTTVRQSFHQRTTMV